MVVRMKAEWGAFFSQVDDDKLLVAKELERSKRWNKEFFGLNNGQLKVVKLNLFKRFSRKVFGAYKGTRFENIFDELSTKDPETLTTEEKSVIKLARDRGLLTEDIKFGTWNMGYAPQDTLNMLVLMEEDSEDIPKGFQELRNVIQPIPVEERGKIFFKYNENIVKNWQREDENSFINDVVEKRKPLYEGAFHRIHEEDVDIICLQESGDEVQDLVGGDYALANGESDSQDPAIIWNKNKFDLVKEHYDDGSKGSKGKFVIVHLRNKRTLEDVIVASAHNQHFNLDAPSGNIDEEAARGNEHLSRVTDTLDFLAKEIEKSTERKPTVLIGADTNASREKYETRLKIPQKIGLKRVKGDKDANNRIDQLFARVDSVSAKPLESLNSKFEKGKLKTTPSDHAPFFATVGRKGVK